MSNEMRFQLTIVDEDGNVITETKGSREVPYIKEIEEKGFRTAFDELETAVLELSKETRDELVTDYLKEASKKKQKAKSAESKQ